MTERSGALPGQLPSASSFERAIHLFEQAWRADSPPEISHVLKRCEPAKRRELACELAVIDMEFRWQASAQGQPPQDVLGARPTWREYAMRFREVRDVGAIAPQLVAEEYRIRQLWGDRPGHDRFASQYPNHLTQLPQWLSQIDAELRTDDVDIAALPEPFEPAAFDPRAPLPWSDYLLQVHLGSGGFGKVYRAIQKSLARPVAVKALHKAQQRDPAIVEQFIQEARLLARLRHPGIVGVQGLGRYPGGGYFLVLDLIGGENLQRRIDRGPLPIAEAVRITIAVAESIHYAHEHSVLHGDLKPSNVIVDAEGAVTVTDFGLGHLLSERADDGAIGRFRGGTLAYLAPEADRGGRVGVSTDVYGLGALLYALLAGQPPYCGEVATAVDLLPRSENERRVPSTLRPEVPPELDDIVMKCLRFDPAARYATSAGVAGALHAVPLEDPPETFPGSAVPNRERK